MVFTGLKFYFIKIDKLATRLSASEVLLILGLGHPVLHVIEFTLFRTWIKLSCQDSAQPDDDTFIWTRCVGTGTSLHHPGQWGPGSRIGKHWTRQSYLCLFWLRAMPGQTPLQPHCFQWLLSPGCCEAAVTFHLDSTTVQPASWKTAHTHKHTPAGPLMYKPNSNLIRKNILKIDQTFMSTTQLGSLFQGC